MEENTQQTLFEDESDSQSIAALTAPRPHSSDTPPALRKVWFENYKSFEKIEVDLGRFNVLVGINNAGKSTLLQGVNLIYDLLKLHREGSHLTGIRNGKVVPSIALPVAAIKDMFYKGVWRQGNQLVSAKVGAEFADGSVIEFSLRLIFANINSRVTRQSGMNGQRLDSLLAKPAVWVPSVVGIVREEEFRTEARRAGLISTGRQNEILRNMLVVLKDELPDKYGTLQRILNERFGAQFSNVSFNQTIDQFVTAEYSDPSGARHDFYSAGSGFIQVVQMLAFVLTRNPGIVLLDEPDAHLHSSLQRVIVDLLEEIAASEQLQVVIATHSKEIINYVDPSRLILVEKGATSVAPASDDVTPISILRSLGAIDNVDAYTMVKNRKCLFVEGPSDSSIFGRFAATLGIHALVGDDRVVTIPTNGADKFEHVQELQVLETLLGGTIASIEIRDRDARTDQLRSRLEASATRTLHVLELDCMESYLINAHILTRTINESLVERGKPTAAKVDDLEVMISETCEDFKMLSTDRIAEKFIVDTRTLENRNVAVTEANRMARETLASVWNDEAARLKYVPGKRILGKLRSKIQEKYGVNFGNERIAESFNAEEVPEEIKSYLREVASL